MSAAAFRLGDWMVEPARNCVHRGGEERQLEPRAMQVLLALVARPGEVVGSDVLLTRCWGSSIGGDNPVHKTIAQLRKVLGDSSSAPRYIETIRKRGYRTVAELAHSTQAPEASWRQETPFRGLAAFEERHSAVFFGRADATAAVLQAIERQIAAGCAAVLVLGPSGAGKTSLMRAGVLARLAGSHPPPGAAVGCRLLLDCADLADGPLFQGLASVLLDADAGRGGPSLFEYDSAAALGRRLRDEPGAVIAALAAGARLHGARTALFIDRFEALLREGARSHGELAELIGFLMQLASSGAVLLLMACRNDFYPQLAGHPALLGLKASGGHVDLTAPNAAEIAQMVRQPARAAGLRFGVRADDSATLDDELCNAARASPDALPLLQYCLEELYRQRSSDGCLRFEVYQQLGGLDGAIGARAEQVLTGITLSQAATLPAVLALLVQVAEDDRTVTARPAPWSALPTPAAAELVQALVNARLFTSSLQADTAVFGLAHEALLRRWPRVVEWVERHRQNLQIRTRLDGQATRWQAGDRPRDLLLPAGLQARQARELREDSDLARSTSAVTMAYIDASLRRARRGELLRYAVLAALLALAVLAGGLSLLARKAQREAEQHRTEAEQLMGFMLGDFVERLRPLGRLDLLDSVSARAMRYLADGRIEASGAALAQRAKALQVLSEVKMARGDGAGAEAALKLGGAILQRQLAAAPADTALLKSAGANAFWLGQLHFDRNDWPGARAHFVRYRDFADRQADSAPGDPDGSIEQAYANNSLGSVSLQQGDAAAAADAFARATALKEMLLARDPGKDSLAADLANSLSWQATAQTRLGKLDGALTLYQREAQIMGRLHRAAPANAAWTTRYGYALHHLGEIHQALGRPALSRDNYAAALRLLQSLHDQDPSNLDVQGRVLATEVSLLGSTDDSRALLRQWQQLQQRLDASARHEPDKRKLARVAALGRLRLAELQLRIKQPGAAATLAPALSSLAALHAQAPDDIEVGESYASALLTQAGMAEPGERQALCGQAQQVLQAYPRKASDYRLLVPATRAALCSGRTAEAAALLQELAAIHYREVHSMQAVERHQP